MISVGLVGDFGGGGEVGEFGEVGEVGEVGEWLNAVGFFGECGGKVGDQMR